MTYTRNTVKGLSNTELHDEYARFRDRHQAMLADGVFDIGKPFGRQLDALADELLRRGRERWGRGAVPEQGGRTMHLIPGSPAAKEHGELTGLRLDQ